VPQLQPTIKTFPQWSFPTANAKFQNSFLLPKQTGNAFIQPRQQFNNNNQALPVPPYVGARPTVTYHPFRPSGAKPQPRPEPMEPMDPPI